MRNDPPLRLAILGSGSGSNCKAILEAIDTKKLPARAVVVMSDRPDAGILRVAAKFGVPTTIIDGGSKRSSLDPATERKLARELRGLETDYVVLAGFMRLVRQPLLDAFPRRILNIHPSLLPDFPGLEAWRQAIEAGVPKSGCTVHFVDAGMDTGEVIARAEVPVLDGDTPESLHARIQVAEHKLYPEVLRQLAAQPRPAGRT